MIARAGVLALALAVIAAPVCMGAASDDLVRDIIRGAKTNSERAVKLFDAAQRTKAAELRISLLAKAVDYGLKAVNTADGRRVVKASLSALDKIDADRQDFWRGRRIEFLRRLYRQSRGRKQKRPAGEKLISALMKTGALHERSKRWTDAMSVYREARVVASSLGLPSRREDIRADYDRAAYLKKADQKIADYRKSLAAKPAHAMTRMLLIRTLMVDMDDPNAAAKDLTDDINETWRTYVPLAAGKVEAVQQDAGKELGDWYYKELTAKTVPFVKRKMLVRARLYYERYLATTEAEDETSLRVRLSLREIEKIFAKYAASFNRDMMNFATRRNRLPPPRQIEALKKKLAELNGDEQVKLAYYQTSGRQIVGLSLENRRLVSIEPLLGLPLTRLSLQGCSSLRTLKGVQGMKLQSLSLRSCVSIESLEGLGDMPLTNLDLQGWSQLKSPSQFRILKGLKLERLNLMECTNLEDLKGIEEMPLLWVNLRGCGSLTSISPLRGKSLEGLGLTRCTSLESLDGLQGMAFDSLTLDGCRSLTGVAPLKGMELERLSMLGCGAIEDLKGLEDMPLTFFQLTGAGSLKSIAPLKGLKLTSLNLAGCSSLADIEPLKGMPLTALDLTGCGSLASIAPLAGMQLKSLRVGTATLVDLSLLKEMPLASLGLVEATTLTDLSPIKDLKLKQLDLRNCRSLKSLTHLKTMPLTSLSLSGCSSLTSLAPLRALKLKQLDLSGCSSLTSLSGIASMRLTSLNMASCSSITSLKPLREMKLKHLDISGCTSLESLEGIGNMPLVSIRVGGLNLSDADRDRLKRIRTLKTIR